MNDLVDALRGQARFMEVEGFDGTATVMRRAAEALLPTPEEVRGILKPPDRYFPLAGFPSLGALLLFVRSAHRLSQKALGERLGLTQAAVALWEGDKRSPRAADLLRIAEALDVEIRVSSGGWSAHLVGGTVSCGVCGAEARYVEHPQLPDYWTFPCGHWFPRSVPDFPPSARDSGEPEATPAKEDGRHR